MTAEEKRARILRMVEPIVRALHPGREERFLGLIRDGPPAYIDEVWERFFRHTSAAEL